MRSRNVAVGMIERTEFERTVKGKNLLTTKIPCFIQFLQINRTELDKVYEGSQTIHK